MTILASVQYVIEACAYCIDIMLDKFHGVRTISQISFSTLFFLSPIRFRIVSKKIRAGQGILGSDGLRINTIIYKPGQTQELKTINLFGLQ